MSSVTSETPPNCWNGWESRAGIITSMNQGVDVNQELSGIPESLRDAGANERISNFRALRPIW